MANFIKPDLHLPLTIDYSENSPLIWENDRSLSLAAFLRIAYRLAEDLPSRPYVINLCKSKKFFLFSLVASLIRQQTTLLPNHETSYVINRLIHDFPGSYVLSEQDVKGFSDKQIVLNDSFLEEGSNWDIPSFPAKSKAVVAFTSGTTGIPKSSVKTWETLVGTSRRLRKRFSFSPRNDLIVFSTVPPSHMYGLEASIMLPLQSGVAINTSRLFFPDDVRMHMMATPGDKALITTPIHLKALARATSDVPPVQKIISATAPLGQALASEIEKIFQSEVYEIYGFTEAGSVATRRTVKCGHWMLLDDFRLAGTEQPGVQKINVPEIGDWIVVPDVIQPEGEFTFSLGGRPDDLIKIGGKRTSLQELTFHLVNAPGVADGIVFQENGNDDHSPSLIGILEMTENGRTQEIIQYLKSCVDPVFIPKRFIQVDSLPRNETGKISLENINHLLEKKAGEKFREN